MFLSFHRAIYKSVLFFIYRMTSLSITTQLKHTHDSKHFINIIIPPKYRYHKNVRYVYKMASYRRSCFYFRKMLLEHEDDFFSTNAHTSNKVWNTNSILEYFCFRIYICFYIKLFCPKTYSAMRIYSAPLLL